MNWKLVKSNPNYEVSDTGLIRKIDGKNCGLWLSDGGYVLVRFSNPRKVYRVHRLVAEAFIENEKNLPIINHKDFVRSNNFVSILEWCTQWHNLNHSSISGRMPKNYWSGKRSPNARLNDIQVELIKNKYKEGGISWGRLGREFGVSKRTIGRIIRCEAYGIVEVSSLPQPPNGE